MGYNFGTAGNLSLSYLQFRYPEESTVRYVNASWFKAITDNIFINASFNQNVDDSRDSSVYLMLTVTPATTLAPAALFSAPMMIWGINSTPAAHRRLKGVGWNVAASQQGAESAQGEVGYLGRYGKVYTGFNSEPDNQYGYVGATGALVMMGGEVFAARQINNGFAVVSTGGIPGVPIKLQNNLVGKSDAQGLLLVTQLNSYQKNEISIDPMDLPANMRITRVTANATPADRSGALVNFGITPVRAALVILVDGRGQVIPQGSTATLSGGSRQSSVVGFDGMTYFDTLEAHNWLQVTTEKGTCSVSFDFPNKNKDIARIGPLVCQ